MLFGLYVISAIRWGMNSDVWMFTESGFFQVVERPPEGVEVDFTPAAGFNFTTVFLIAHGWFYVVYLLSAFVLWSSMRWPFWRFLAIAIAGTLIIVSFIVEWWIVRDVRRTLKELETDADQTKNTAENIDPRKAKHV